MSQTRAGVGARFRRALARLGASDEDLAAEALREASEQAGSEEIAGCADRDVVQVSGTVRTVTLQPRAGAPALEVELFDGTAALVLVFLGRRRIAGIEPGRMLVAHGRVAVADDRRVMFNPRYELRPLGA